MSCLVVVKLDAYVGNLFMRQREFYKVEKCNNTSGGNTETVLYKFTTVFREYWKMTVSGYKAFAVTCLIVVT